MSVGFRSGAIWDEIGDSEFIHAFFSTISFRLESNNWGSKYPVGFKNTIRFILITLYVSNSI